MTDIYIISIASIWTIVFLYVYYKTRYLLMFAMNDSWPKKIEIYALHCFVCAIWPLSIPMYHVHKWHDRRYWNKIGRRNMKR